MAFPKLVKPMYDIIKHITIIRGYFSLFTPGARKETEAKRGSALLLALHSFYNSPRVHVGWLLHGCPQRLVTKKNLMCASLHQGPLAASIWLSAIWCCDSVCHLYWQGQRGHSFGEMHRSIYVGYWNEDWITVSSVDVFVLDYQLLMYDWTVNRERSTGLWCAVQLDTADTACQQCACPLMSSTASCKHNKLIYIYKVDVLANS